jgi:hypothetical protein
MDSRKRYNQDETGLQLQQWPLKYVSAQLVMAEHEPHRVTGKPEEDPGQGLGCSASFLHDRRKALNRKSEKPSARQLLWSVKDQNSGMVKEACRVCHRILLQTLSANAPDLNASFQQPRISRVTLNLRITINASPRHKLWI